MKYVIRGFMKPKFGIASEDYILFKDDMNSIKRLTLKSEPLKSLIRFKFDTLIKNTDDTATFYNVIYTGECKFCFCVQGTGKVNRVRGKLKNISDVFMCDLDINILEYQPESESLPF